MKSVRCAIYTRKSSEEGLEQDFNSLDAQRESCAAYILSQASEGWSGVAERYDDGGISGGSLERPALQRMLCDIEAGKIDIIVVYKVDRLTRSLLDFAKLVEAFDRKGVSFVSITQSFNTTTSMGRLTLNMLLSFAQFEREVTAERIRDKLAASKAKGMWMGGIPPLGYRPDGRSLAILEEQAELIRSLYIRYLELGSVRALAEELIAHGRTAPLRTTTNGRSFGGGFFSRGQLYAILKNPVYTGHIVHRDKIYPGLHMPIIDQALWDQVQARLRDQTQGAERVGRQSRIPTASPLAGLLFDEAGAPLTPSHAAKPSPGNQDAARRRYRYYVSKALIDGTAGQAAVANVTPWRIPAREIEQLVASELAQLFADPLVLMARLDVGMPPPESLRQVQRRCAQTVQDLEFGLGALLRQLIARVQIASDEVTISMARDKLHSLLDLPCPPSMAEHLTLTSTVRLTRTGHVMRIIHDNGAASANDIAPSLVKLVTRARTYWETLKTGTVNPTTLAAQEGVTVSYLLRVVRVAFLAPSVSQAILEGRARASLEAQQLLGVDFIPIRWQEQERLLLPG